jgi:hypothetical protein
VYKYNLQLYKITIQFSNKIVLYFQGGLYFIPIARGLNSEDEIYYSNSLISSQVFGTSIHNISYWTITRGSQLCKALVTHGDWLCMNSIGKRGLFRKPSVPWKCKKTLHVYLPMSYLSNPTCRYKYPLCLLADKKCLYAY